MSDAFPQSGSLGPLELYRRLSSQTVTSSFQYQRQDPSGGQVYNRSNTFLANLSTPMGYYAMASGNRSSAFGAFAYSREDSSVAVGIYAQALGPSAIALGDQSKASGLQAIAIGPFANALGIQSVAVGYYALVTGQNGLGFGNAVYATGLNGAAFGSASKAQGTSSSAFGYAALANAEYASCFGAASNVPLAAYGCAFGYNATAGGSGDYPTVIGANSSANSARATVLGGLSVSTGIGGILIGKGLIDAGNNYGLFIGHEGTVSAQRQATIGNPAPDYYYTAFRIGQEANGQYSNLNVTSENLAIAAAASTVSTISIPAGAIVLAVSVRTTTAIPTAATYTVTGSTSATVFNTAAVSTAANSTDMGTAAGAYYNAAVQNIRITPNAVPAAGTGTVRITIHYFVPTVPSS